MNIESTQNILNSTTVYIYIGEMHNYYGAATIF